MTTGQIDTYLNYKAYEEAYETKKKLWLKHQKAFGFDGANRLYGGCILNAKYTHERLVMYLNGEISKIDELEEEVGIYTLTDLEADVKSYWTTPIDKFKHPQYRKTTNKRGCVAEGTGILLDSLKLLEHVGNLIEEKLYVIGNIDATIIAQRPKMAPHIPQMRENIAKALKIDVPKFNKKKFEAAVQYALTLTTKHNEFYPLIRNAFIESGVILVILPNIKLVRNW